MLCAGDDVNVTLPWILIDGQIIELTKMDMETLSAQFQREQGRPLNYCGNIVLPIFKKDLNQELVSLVITRLSSLRKPEQGIRIKVERGEIHLEGKNYKEIILWEDSSPDSVEMTVISKGKSQLKIWNVWRVDSLVNAWVGNAGMVINEMATQSLEFQCSDGVGSVDFSNLVFVIRILDGT